MSSLSRQRAEREFALIQKKDRSAPGPAAPRPDVDTRLQWLEKRSEERTHLTARSAAVIRRTHKVVKAGKHDGF